jgi:hypothetical protein
MSNIGLTFLFFVVCLCAHSNSHFEHSVIWLSGKKIKFYVYSAVFPLNILSTNPLNTQFRYKYKCNLRVCAKCRNLPQTLSHKDYAYLLFPKLQEGRLQEHLWKLTFKTFKTYFNKSSPLKHQILIYFQSMKMLISLLTTVRRGVIQIFLSHPVRVEWEEMYIFFFEYHSTCIAFSIF